MKRNVSSDIIALGCCLITYLNGVVAVIHIGEGHFVDIAFLVVVLDIASSPQSNQRSVCIDGFSRAQADEGSS